MSTTDTHIDVCTGSEATNPPSSSPGLQEWSMLQHSLAAQQVTQWQLEGHYQQYGLAGRQARSGVRPAILHTSEQVAVTAVARSPPPLLYTQPARYRVKSPGQPLACQLAYMWLECRRSAGGRGAVLCCCCTPGCSPLGAWLLLSTLPRRDARPSCRLCRSFSVRQVS